jgi:redox-sensitive bicupin YhaK (pirin superfamily)
MHGIQTWVALPQAFEEAQPEFLHYAADRLPQVEREGVRLRVIAGSAFGMQSPVRVYAPTLYVDAEFTPGSRLVVPSEYEERAIYIVSGDVRIDAEQVPAQRMLVLAAGSEVEIAAESPARVLLCGGAPLDGERHLWWNFVASSKERIERAKADWLAQAIGQVPGETEFIPLPEH